MSSGTRKRSRFQTATKRRVQAMTWQEFDQWVELSKMLSFRTYAELTLWGEVYCGEPRSGWVGTGYSARPRDTLDLAYGIMKDPDAKLEVWDDSAKEMVERELPYLGVLAGGGEVSERRIVPTKGDRLAERLKAFLLDLHDRGLITWINETEEDAEAIGVAIAEFADRELGDKAREAANG